MFALINSFILKQKQNKNQYKIYKLFDKSNLGKTIWKNFSTHNEETFGLDRFKHLFITIPNTHATDKTGANTGQSGGRSTRLGYVSLGSQTPKLKKVKWKKIKFC